MNSAYRHRIVPYWHTAAGRFPLLASPERWAKTARLEWSIVEAPVTYAPAQLQREPLMAFGAMNVLYRSDTSQPLAVVPSSFNVTQPIESLSFFRRYAQFYEYDVVDAGAMQDGRVLWCLLNAGRDAVLLGGDRISGHLLLFARCDCQVAAFLNPICVLTDSSSTLPGSSHALPPVPLPWSSEFLLPDTLMDIATLEAELFNVIGALELLAGQAVTPGTARDYFSSVLDMQPLSDSRPPRHVRERQLRVLIDVYDSHAREAGLRSVWGLLRTAVIHIDHSRRFPSVSAHRHYAWLGAGSVRKQFAIELALALIA